VPCLLRIIPLRGRLGFVYGIGYDPGKSLALKAVVECFVRKRMGRYYRFFGALACNAYYLASGRKLRTSRNKRRAEELHSA